jgi:SAM-dependent MidA family methyltransferase
MSAPRPVGDVPEVAQAVRDAVAAAGGRIPFARFMDVCLYHPARGYYSAFGPPAQEGAREPAADYVTSVDLHPVFGHLVAREAAAHLERVASARPGPLAVVELGPGRGLMARDVLQALAKEFPHLHRRLRYILVEPNAGWEQVQRANLLPEHAAQVRWVRCAGARLPLRGLRGVVLANEVLDALPFHLVEQGEAGLREVFVAAHADGALVEAAGPPSDPAIARSLKEGGVVLELGQRAEVSLQAQALCREVARSVESGAAIFIDYGDEAGLLYDGATRPRGTMRCFFRHRQFDDPLVRMGRQDITAHVDFTAAIRSLKDGGMRVGRLERQAAFLERHGLGEFVRRLEADQARVPREAFVRHRRAFMALSDRRGLGGNLVLVGWKP